LVAFWPEGKVKNDVIWEISDRETLKEKPLDVENDDF
jgi:hypothetical protein